MSGVNRIDKYVCEKCGNYFRLKYSFNKHKGDCITYKKVVKMLEVENASDNKDIQTLR